MPRWEETVESLFNLWKFCQTDYGIKFFQSYVSSYNESYGDGPPVQKIGGRGDLATIVEKICTWADPIYVDPDMFLLAKSAFNTFVEEPLLETDLITRNGFIFLPEPIEMLDAHKLTTKNRAILWHEATNGEFRGIWLMLFSDVRDKDDWWDKILEGMDKGLPIIAGNRLYLNYITAWEYGKERDYAVPQAYAAEKDALKGVSPTRYIQVLFRLMLQTISLKEQKRADRHARRRMAKENWNKSDVTVITLRRPRADHDGESNPVEWHVRWLVRGHWRNQWFPSLNAHRQIWISPYIKGPEDAPLQIKKTRVFELVR